MKTAVVLFNLGGPDTLKNVKPFLFNLFCDPAIINLPGFFRIPLAAFIASKREAEAQHIYAAIGDKSPLLENTNAQAAALEAELNKGNGENEYKTFISMRYWHPMSKEVAAAVRAWAPDEVVYLPLYPQYSTTTTASSFAEFDKHLGMPARKINCYPTLDGFIDAQVELILPLFEEVRLAAEAKKCTASLRILFSAHGLPQKIIRGGDPYQWQCEQTAKAIIAKLETRLAKSITRFSQGGATKAKKGKNSIGYLNTYQSRVGPLQWTEPYTDAEIARAGKEKVPLLIVPIAFVSEHSETLYELDQLYRKLAEEKKVPAYARAPTVSVHPAFIKGLAALVHGDTGGTEKEICPLPLGKCVCR
jgi:ferrochelatase